MKDKRCEDCPGSEDRREALIDRREADAAYRSMVTTRLDNYDKLLDKLDKSVTALADITQINFNKIYFRIGAISGGAGLITGMVATLATLHFHG